MREGDLVLFLLQNLGKQCARRTLSFFRCRIFESNAREGLVLLSLKIWKAMRERVSVLFAAKLKAMREGDLVFFPLLKL